MKVEKQPCSACAALGHSFIAVCSPAGMDTIDEAKTRGQYKKGQTLFFEGNMPLGIYCVKDGAFKIYKTGLDGKDQILRIAQAGEFLGYRALIADEPYSASAEAIEPASACFFPKQTFLNILASEPAMSRQMLKSLCHDLGMSHERILAMAQKSVRERMAETLLTLLENLMPAESQDPDVIPVQLPREDLANLAGTTTESAIRLLTEFKQDQYIEMLGKRIRILNKPALRRVARI